MAYKRGCIYLANFNPSKGTEAGKLRPCLVIQSNLLNEAGHPSTTVLPLTTALIDAAEPLRYRIKARDGLTADSDIMLDQTRTIDNKRITSSILATLSSTEIIELESLWQIVLGFDLNFTQF
ncbi:MAG: type II toxin-antitoxin system PemK/MazF family toxin [Xanthomonadales bacterium]|nr:type II toxin-antitoxin system PemK/MazF family toxin [Xanthomonadales bacterium]